MDFFDSLEAVARTQDEAFAFNSGRHQCLMDCGPGGNKHREVVAAGREGERLGHSFGTALGACGAILHWLLSATTAIHDTTHGGEAETEKAGQTEPPNVAVRAQLHEVQSEQAALERRCRDATFFGAADLASEGPSLEAMTAKAVSDHCGAVIRLCRQLLGHNQTLRVLSVDPLSSVPALHAAFSSRSAALDW